MIVKISIILTIISLCLLYWRCTKNYFQLYALLWKLFAFFSTGVYSVTTVLSFASIIVSYIIR